jgi:hypothetical protein
MVSAFVAMGELAQGLADAGFERQGFDDAGPSDDASLAVLCAMAAAIQGSPAPDREAFRLASAIDAFGLDTTAAAALCDAFDRQAGRRVDRRLVAWLMPCRLAFAHGRDQLALDANRGSPEEPRLATAAARSRAALRRALETL